MWTLWPQSRHGGYIRLPRRITETNEIRRDCESSRRKAVPQAIYDTIRTTRPPQNHPRFLTRA